MWPLAPPSSSPEVTTTPRVHERPMSPPAGAARRRGRPHMWNPTKTPRLRDAGQLERGSRRDRVRLGRLGADLVQLHAAGSRSGPLSDEWCKTLGASLGPSERRPSRGHSRGHTIRSRLRRGPPSAVRPCALPSGPVRRLSRATVLRQDVATRGGTQLAGLPAPLNPQVPGSNPGGRTIDFLVRAVFGSVPHLAESQNPTAIPESSASISRSATTGRRRTEGDAEGH